MPDDIDKDLLQRLQALRGASATPEKPSPSIKPSVDPIERTKTPTREDALAARLKSLRNRDEPPSSSAGAFVREQKKTTPSSQSTLKPSAFPAYSYHDGDGMNVTSQEDEKAVDDFLARGDDMEQNPTIVTRDDQVKDLLDELSRSVPQDVSKENAKGQSRATKDEDSANDSDDSNGEIMNREADDIIAKFREELEFEASFSKDDSPNPEENPGADEAFPDAGTISPSDLSALPSVPSDLGSVPSSNAQRASSTDIDDMTARLAALRAPTNEDAVAFPSVPASKPSGKPVKRLTTRTNYTDDDMGSWCTVCLEDATLRCLGCDEDVYCTRCWKEMHVGPYAGFDERSHKAVHFTRDKKKEKVAIGAS